MEAARKHTRTKQSRNNQVYLDRVLGITASGSSSVTSDPRTGLVAYPAGCVIVLLHPRHNKQTHIVNVARKPFTALAFSQDGRLLVSGESGHAPCVRVWCVCDGSQLSEARLHGYGVACVAFSPNGVNIVSVGHEHDMTVCVWDWRRAVLLASNKVSSRVLGVSVSEDGRYFVTAGQRHVKFWKLDSSTRSQVTKTVPLVGRSALLGDHKNSVFSGVACGRGRTAGKTFVVTSNGLLCRFNEHRQIDAWVRLKTSSSSSVCVTEWCVYCGCSDGTVSLFASHTLELLTSLPLPHRLGDHPPPPDTGVRLSTTVYPDILALSVAPGSDELTCVYADHSVYVWDTSHVQQVAAVFHALFHYGAVWSLEMCPDGSFVTCSSDNTLRLWQAPPQTPPPDGLHCNDLLRVVYVGDGWQPLPPEAPPSDDTGADGKSGIRVLGVSPDGSHLVAGDRFGNLRIFELQFFTELQKIEAHDSEIICLDFTPPHTGVQLLATAGRDRLIHVFNLDDDFSLEQTLYDHSGTISTVKFTGPGVSLVSCGSDKSIYFRSTDEATEGVSFSRSHHVVEKVALNDMDVDASHNHAAIGCQDRSVRVYDVASGRLKRCFKGSCSDSGTLLKVQFDQSGTYLASSCSDKNIFIYDYEAGECVATLFGHAEIVTCMRFTDDCTHLITASTDSCVFLWRLTSQMTANMKTKLDQRRSTTSYRPARRETFFSVPAAHETPERPLMPAAVPEEPPLLQTNGKLPMWFRKLQGNSSRPHPAESPLVLPAAAGSPQHPRSRWELQPGPPIFCSLLSPCGLEDSPLLPQSLEMLLGQAEEEEEEVEVPGDPQELEDKGLGAPQEPGDPQELEDKGLGYPQEPGDPQDLEDEGIIDPLEPGDPQELEDKGLGYPQEPGDPQDLEDEGIIDPQEPGDPQDLEDEGIIDPLEPGDPQELEDKDLGDPQEPGDPQEFEDIQEQDQDHHADEQDEMFQTDLKNLQPEDHRFLNPRLSISARFLTRYRLRMGSCQAPPVSIPTSIQEDPIQNTSLQVCPNLPIDGSALPAIPEFEATPPRPALICCHGDRSTSSLSSPSVTVAMDAARHHQTTMLSWQPEMTESCCHGDVLQVVNDFKQSLSRLLLVYQEVNRQMGVSNQRAVLQEALVRAQSDLASVLHRPQEGEEL